MGRQTTIATAHGGSFHLSRAGGDKARQLIQEARMALHQYDDDPGAYIAELEERVRQLEGLLEASAPPISDKLSKSQNRIMSVLLAKSFATHDQLYDAVSYNSFNPPEPHIIHVHICKMRKRLKPIGVAIENMHGQGYRISPSDKEKIRDQAV